MEWATQLAIAAAPVVALLIAAMFKGALAGVVRYLEGRFAFDLAAEHESVLLDAVDRAVEWVSHKIPRANDNPEKRAEKLAEAMVFVRREIEARGLAESLKGGTDRRLANLIESVVAVKKRAAGET